MSATRCRTTDLACYPLDNLKNRPMSARVRPLKEMPARFSAVSRDALENTKKVLRPTGTNAQETTIVCHNKGVFGKNWNGVSTRIFGHSLTKTSFRINIPPRDVNVPNREGCDTFRVLLMPMPYPRLSVSHPIDGSIAGLLDCWSHIECYYSNMKYPGSSPTAGLLPLYTLQRAV